MALLCATGGVEGDEAKGKSAIRKVVVATFKALPGATQVMKSQSVVPLGCGYSAVIGHWEISFKDAGGKMQMASVRTSEILKKTREQDALRR